MDELTPRAEVGSLADLDHIFFVKGMGVGWDADDDDPMILFKAWEPTFDGDHYAPNDAREVDVCFHLKPDRVDHYAQALEEMARRLRLGPHAQHPN